MQVWPRPGAAAPEALEGAAPGRALAVTAHVVARVVTARVVTARVVLCSDCKRYVQNCIHLRSFEQFHQINCIERRWGIPSVEIHWNASWVQYLMHVSTCSNVPDGVKYHEISPPLALVLGLAMKQIETTSGPEMVIECIYWNRTMASYFQAIPEMCDHCGIVCGQGMMFCAYRIAEYACI